MTLLLCFVSLTMVAQVSQSTTPITAGNRIAMGVPVQQAPQKGNVSDERKADASFDITMRPDGHVSLLVHNLPVGEKYSARVFTVSGQLAATMGPTSSPTSTLNLTHLQSGVYIVKLTAGSHTVARTITKE